LILQAETGSSTDVLKNNISPIYQEAYESDKLYEQAVQNIAILFLLPLLIIYLRMTSSMLSEKEKKIRETMSIMGMKLPIYYVTWFLRYFFTFLIVHLIGAAIVAQALPKVGFIAPFIIFILFDIVLIIQSFFIQVFFSRAKIGVIIALLFFLIQYIISFVSSTSDNPTESVNTAISIIPHAAFVLAFETMFYIESVKSELSFSNSFSNYTLSTAVVSFILNAIFWLALTWYLEQVFPNEFGAKKHPLWCCFDKKNKVTDY
jgi:ATP-binding cassette, subfamily A (ABC1), member 3